MPLQALQPLQPFQPFTTILETTQFMFQCLGAFKGCEEQRIAHIAEHMLSRMGIKALVIRPQGILTSHDAPFVFVIYENEVCCYHVNKSSKHVVFYKANGGEPCRSLLRVLDRMYSGYILETHAHVHAHAYTYTSDDITPLNTLACCLIFCLDIQKKCESSENISQHFLNFFQESILLSYRQMEGKVSLNAGDEDSLLCHKFKCKTVIKQYINALTMDEKTRRNTIYKHLKNDVNLLNAKKHMKMSWNMCVCNLKKEIISLEYSERYDVGGDVETRMLSEYTNMLNTCRQNLNNHFRYLVTLYSALYDEPLLEDQRNDIHSIVIYYNEQINNVTATINTMIDMLCLTPCSRP
jgi:hypothetical protein